MSILHVQLSYMQAISPSVSPRGSIVVDNRESINSERMSEGKLKALFDGFATITCACIQEISIKMLYSCMQLSTRMEAVDWILMKLLLWCNNK